MRINLFAGPGAGKSTTAAWLFSELKNQQKSVELVHEYVKTWAYQRRIPKKHEQVYLLAKQVYAEHGFLSCGVKHIVTDAPALLTVFYAEGMIAEGLELIYKEFESTFPSLNIFLDRGDRPYVASGRYQTKEQALELDQRIKSFVMSRMPIETFRTDDHDQILEYVLASITEEERQDVN